MGQLALMVGAKEDQSNSISVGIDLGGTSLRVGAFNEAGRLLSNRSMRTRVADGPAEVVSDMAAAVRSILSELGTKVDGVGLGSPGPLNLQTGVLCELPNFPGWSGFPLRDALSSKLQMEVVLESDASAATLAEWKSGAGKAEGVNSMAMLTLGTGVGSGLILGGRVWSGMVGMGGEVGHVTVNPEGPVCTCGGRGCLEMYASATGVLKSARAAAAMEQNPGLASLFRTNPNAGAHDVAALAEAGDPGAKRIYSAIGHYIGLSLAGLVNTLDLPLYVIGGGVAAAWNLFSPEMFLTLRRYSYVYRMSEPTQRLTREKNRPFVTLALLGADAGLIGAAMLVGHSHTRSAEAVSQRG
ncbi:MAG: ROK family protein [Acidobacteriaceae bacterium]